MTTLNLSLITTQNKEFLQKQMDIDKSAGIACGKSLKGNLQSTLLNYQVKLGLEYWNKYINHCKPWEPLF